MNHEVLNDDPYLEWVGRWEACFYMLVPMKGDGL